MISYEIKYIVSMVIMPSERTDKSAGENGAEANICTQEGGSKRRQDKPE